jgi:branched-chain amino acid transport system ATP-binding protein
MPRFGKSIWDASIMNTGALELDAVFAGYGPIRVLDAVSLALPKGSRLALLGRNGAGKSTLMRAIMGLATHQGGRVLLDGVAISAWPTSRRARAGLAYVPQTREIFAGLSVEENLLLGLRQRPTAALDEAYALFPRLRQRRGHAGSQLSGGEQQMLSIARALLSQPRVLLLDEPLEGLAPQLVAEVMAALTRLGDAGDLTILLAEQHIETALACTDTAVILDRGRVVWAGPSADLAAQGDTIERHLGLATGAGFKGSWWS